VRERRSLFATLHSRDFRLLAAGLAVSQVGDWLYNVSLIVFVLQATGSAAWVAAAGIIRLLPYVLFAPIGGVIADRYPRRWVMIASDLIRAALMAALTVVVLTSGPPLAAIILAGLATTFAVAYGPCVAAAMPALVDEDDLSAANALTTTITNLSFALGPAIGGVLLLLGSASVAFVVNAATFLLSAVITILIRADLGPEAAPATATEKAPTMREGLAEGIRALRGSPDAVTLVAALVVTSLLYGQEIVLYALVASDRLGLGTDGVGFLYAAIGVGGIAAAGLARRAADRPQQGFILAVAALLCGLPMMVLAVTGQPNIAYLVLAVEGAAMVVVDVLALTSMQRILGNEVLGRAFGAIDSLTVAGMLAGSIIAPIAVRWSSLEVALLFGGGLTIGASLLVLRRARAIDRRASERASLLAPRVTFLEALDLFDGTSRATLEGLAEMLTLESVDRGVAIIRQGDEPDDLFLIVEGTMEVIRREGGADRVVGEVGPGTYVGEIGLLRGIPRTATVLTRTPCQLYRLAGQEFLRIVTEGAVRATGLNAGMQARLATHRSTHDHPPASADR